MLNNNVYSFFSVFCRITVKYKVYLNDLTMRRSPRRPLILKRRKLPFQQNEPPAAVPHRQDAAPGFKEAAKPASSQCLPTGVRIIDHPSISDTQVVVIPKMADIQTVIGVLTTKGKECGANGPNKFILLSGNGSWEGEAFCPPAAEGVSTRTTCEESIKTETVHGSTDAKPLTGFKPCMRIRCHTTFVSLLHQIFYLCNNIFTFLYQ